MRARVVLRHTGDTARGPTGIRAIIEDPSFLGQATYANDVGELYFTIPLNHPQAGECEPFKTHWEVQYWDPWGGGGWYPLHDYAYGLLTDLDFDQDEVIVYGMDYLGLLSLSLDTRTPEERPDGTYKNFNKSTRQGGAKYKQEKISYILKEQLDLAKAEEESLTGFIHRGNVDTMDTEISIYVSYRQRLDFIKGLLDSYRQGTGIGSRLSVKYDNGDDQWQWRIDADPGVEQPGLRFEYGGLVQGFRILTYEDFATRAMGVGVILDSTQPIYRMFPQEGDADSYVAQYGNMQVANVWEDLSDRNDLKRRVRQLYAERSRIGKRVALGLKVHSLMPFQLYDLSDHVRLDLKRFALDTQAFGSGWWTIWGTEWRLFPDGHDELTLVVRPREDTKPADPDILTSSPVVRKPALCWGEGPPVAGEECDCGEDGYVDVLTGRVYVCSDGELVDTVGGEWEPAPFAVFDDFERPGTMPIAAVGDAVIAVVQYLGYGWSSYSWTPKPIGVVSIDANQAGAGDYRSYTAYVHEVLSTDPPGQAWLFDDGSAPPEWVVGSYEMHITWLRIKGIVLPMVSANVRIGGTSRGSVAFPTTTVDFPNMGHSSLATTNYREFAWAVANAPSVRIETPLGYVLRNSGLATVSGAPGSPQSISFAVWERAAMHTPAQHPGGVDDTVTTTCSPAVSEVMTMRVLVRVT